MKTKAFIRLLFLSLLAVIVMAGCSGSKGSTGATGPAGPTMPVIQSVVTYGLPAMPGTSFTAVVSAQSAQGLTLTYAWAVSKGWSVVGGGTTPMATLKAIGGYDAIGYAMVTVSDTSNRSATGVAILNTLDGTWGSAALIPFNTLAQDAYVPQVAFDASGNAIAVWRQTNGTPYRIYANRYTAGIGWGTPLIIDAGPQDAADPQVAFDPSGNAIAVWRQTNGTQYLIYANRYAAGTGWVGAAPIDAGAQNAYDPQVAFDPSGNAIAVWFQSDGTHNRIYANRYAVGTGWVGAAPIDAVAQNAYNPQVAIDPSGNAIAVWQQSDGTHNRIYANRYAVGTDWVGAAPIDAGTQDAYDPQVAIDPSGNAIAVWPEYDGTHYRIYANRYAAGTGWGSAALIDAGAQNAYSPQVAIDASGNAIAVWQQSDGTHNRIYANRYTAGTGWGSAAAIETNPYDASRPQISFDASGNAIAAWYQNDGIANDRVYANRYIAGIGWGTPVIINAGDTDVHEVGKIAFDPIGNAMAVWSQCDKNSVYRIYANRYQ